MSPNSNKRKTRIVEMTDPRFPGGTASAVAQEIMAIHRHADISVVGVKTKMFKDRPVNGRMEDAMEEAGIGLKWANGVTRSEIVIFHNPACLKFEKALPSRILCDRIYVICHENMLLPNGEEAFDVAGCLRIIKNGSLCRRRVLVPISPYNRTTVNSWFDNTDPKDREGWEIADFDWFNICDFKIIRPEAKPRDRRGRMSRPGFEKFPPLPVMKMIFPEESETVRILGGDSLLLDAENIPEWWEVLPFGAEMVNHFLKSIDFFVYYTNANWRESFGRVLAEAIAAGKVVITDPETAANFRDQVIGCSPEDVTPIITRFMEEPEEYVRFVDHAQRGLSRFNGDAFVHNILHRIIGKEESAS